MIIDISSYNGKIDWATVAAEANVNRIIHRGTTKNGTLDGRLIENVKGIAKAYFNKPYPTLDVYKFSYARSYDAAVVEAYNLIKMLRIKGVSNIFYALWLDLEDFDGRSHTTAECAAVIAAYESVCAQFEIKFGIYCNYNYVRNILPKWAANDHIWLAKWSDNIGDLGEFKSNTVLWQYTTKGKVPGIPNATDLSREVNI